MNPDDMRAGRMLAQGDLRLVALALIARAPRHGYEIIKLVEEKTADWYSPSPGIVYPTLTYLEEAGYVTVSTEGAKKLYTITDEGRAYLDANRDLADVVLDRLSAIGERVNRWRREQRRSEHAGAAAAARSHVRPFARDCRQAAGRRCRGRSASCRNSCSPAAKCSGAIDSAIEPRNHAELEDGPPSLRRVWMHMLGPNPSANRRAGMRRSSGNASNSLNSSGGFGVARLARPDR